MLWSWLGEGGLGGLVMMVVMVEWRRSKSDSDNGGDSQPPAQRV